MLTAAPARGISCAFLNGASVRQPRPTAGKDAVVSVKIAMEVEMYGESCIVQHAPSVPTGRKKLACFDAMMFVEHKCVGMMRDGASINDSLTVILASGLEVIKFEQSICCRVKTDVSGPYGQFSVIYRDPAVVNQARIAKTVGAGQLEKIVPVQRTSQAFTVQYRVAR